MSENKKKPVPVSVEELAPEVEDIAAPESNPAQIAVTQDVLNELIAKAVAQALAAQKAESDGKIAELEAKLAAKEIAKTANPGGDYVTLVYLSDSPGILNKVPGITLRCTHYGEEFSLPRYQFDQIVGVYRPWFDEGILAVSRDDIGVAAKKGLRTQDEYALKPSVLNRLGTMSIDELKKTWKACVNENERLSMIFYYKRKFIEGKEPGFRETERVLAMNALTNQGFAREAIEISGAPTKIQPRDFMSIK